MLAVWGFFACLFFVFAGRPRNSSISWRRRRSVTRRSTCSWTSKRKHLLSGWKLNGAKVLYPRALCVCLPFGPLSGDSESEFEEGTVKGLANALAHANGKQKSSKKDRPLPLHAWMAAFMVRAFVVSCALLLCLCVPFLSRPMRMRPAGAALSRLASPCPTSALCCGSPICCGRRASQCRWPSSTTNVLGLLRRC